MVSTIGCARPVYCLQYKKHKQSTCACTTKKIVWPGGIAGHTTLTVSNATLTTITVTPLSANIALGTSQQFTATGNYTDGPHDLTNQATWTSSNVGTAVVNSAGVAISAATGTTTIKAAMGTVNGTATLTVH